MYLLDTNIISQIRKINAPSCPIAFKSWFDSVDLTMCYLSAITVFEVELGILQKSRKDPVQAQILRDWFENQVKTEFATRILPIDTQSALKSAGFHVPNPASLPDSLIAGVAVAYNMILVTKNAKDFIDFQDIQLFNPFE